jgi:class 3 adenylate cyclase/tetratricopeptide (TPR) repeat protein
VISCPHCGAPAADGAHFCPNCGTPLAGAPPGAEVRKTVTILFCDVVRSTSVGERVDPESLRRVMTRYFDEIRTIVERHGGVVEKFIGDAVMAVFGVPTVHEDDALRAARAAVEIRQRLAVLDPQLERERGISVAWRTGINTGEVVAGDARAGQRFVTGDAVNVAARLEQAAQPGEVLIGTETYQMVRDAVTVEPVQSILARGKSAPVDAYRLLAAAPGTPIHAHRLASPMVGRQRPRRLLAEAYEQAMGERVCHLFTVLGAAGVGKSRLVNEFLHALADGVLVLQGRCLPYGDGITYWPIAEVVRRAARLDETDDEPTMRRKIGQLIEDDRDRLQVVERIGEMIGLLETGGAAEETFWAVRTLFESMARQRPLVVVLDDLHWAEPTLLDLVEHLADWTRDAPLLLVCLARQDLLEARPSWGGGKANATTVTLEPLNDDESRQLVVNLLGLVELATPLEEKIASAAEGNPLFVEEMVGMLIDSGDLVRENGGWRAASDLTRVAVPPTIQALLAARLDGLPAHERRVLERGSVEGKVFHRSAVAELAPADLAATIPTYLRSLTRKELLRPDRPTFTGDDAFRFRHQLIRDAAYGSLPKETRADLHARFARWLMRVAADRLAEYEEILGYHFEQAYRYRVELGPADDEARALGAAAAEHLAASGRRAVERGDMHAATRLLERAVELAPSASASRTRMMADLGDVLGRAGEVRAGDRLLVEAMERAEVMGDTLGRAWAEVLRLDTLATLGQTSVEETIQRSQELLAIFEEQGDERGAERASFTLAQNHFFAGRVSLAEAILGEHIARYPPGEAPDIFVSWLLGALYWGPSTVQDTLRRIPGLVGTLPSSRFVEAWALQIRGALRGMIGEFDEGREMVVRAMAMMEELGQRIRAQRAAGLWLGPLELRAANYGEAERVLVGAHDALREMGDIGYSSTVAGYVAELYVRMGRFDAADEYVKVTLENAAPDDVDAQAQALSTGARVLAARGEIAAAEKMARQAVKIADATEYATRRGAVWWDLGEVLLAAGRPEEAAQAMRRAMENFEAKGVTVEADRMRRRLSEVELGTRP